MVWMGRSLVVRARTNQAVVIKLLDDVGSPSRDARHRKHRRKQVNVNAQRVIGGSRVEVYVGVQLAIGDDELFDLMRDLEPLGITARRAQVARHSPQVCGPRILGVIHAMAESWN